MSVKTETYWIAEARTEDLQRQEPAHLYLMFTREGGGYYDWHRYFDEPGEEDRGGTRFESLDKLLAVLRGRVGPWYYKPEPHEIAISKVTRTVSVSIEPSPVVLGVA